MIDGSSNVTSPDLYQRYFEHANIGMALTSPEKGWLQANPRLCEMLGYTEPELKQTTWADLTHPDDLQADMAQFECMLAGETDAYALNKRFLRKDGHVLHTHLTVACERDVDGKIAVVLASLSDRSAEQAAQDQLQRSEQRFRLLAESTLDGIWDWDLAAQTLWLSPSWKAQLGYRDAELANHFDTWAGLIHPEDQDQVMSHLHAFIDDPAAVWQETFRLRHRDGGWRQILARGIAVIGEHGRPVRIFGVHIDITDQREAVSELRALSRDLERVLKERTRELAESESRFRGAFETAPQGMALVGMDGRWLKVNEALCRITGYDRDALLATDFQTITHPEDLNADLALFERLRRGEIPCYQLEKRYLRKDRAQIWVLLSVSLVRDEAGEPRYLVSQIHDIDARKRVEQALREAEARYRNIADYTYDWETWIDADGRLRYSSPACERITGHALQDFLRNARLLGRIVHPADRTQWQAHMAGITETGRARELEYRIRRADGAERWLRRVDHPMFTDDGRYAGLRGSTRDVTEVRAAEQALKEEKAFIEAVVNAAQALILVLDPAARVINCNPYLEKLTGWSPGELVGRNWIDTCVPPPEREQVHRIFATAIATHRTTGNVNQILTRDGTLRDISWYDELIRDDAGEPHYLIAVGIDVTEQRRAEQALRESNERLEVRVRERTAALEAAQAAMIQNEKLSSLGTLVAGLTHEINNPLMGVLNYLQYAEERSDGKVAKALGKAERELGRIKEIVSRLLNYARSRRESGLDPVDLAETARRAMELVEADLRMRHIVLDDALDDGLPRILADGDQLQQVCLNLMINARDAVGSVQDVEGDSARPSGHWIRVSAGSNAQAVWLDVADSGQGVPAGVQRRIFDPFFTTKPVGQGTGLGLSVSLGIVKSLGGTLSLEETGAAGSRFRMRFPRASS